VFHDILGHRSMLDDKVRIGAYRKAIRYAVKAGDVVLDLGAGSGILSFLAVQSGARKVYAVERGNIIDDARQLAEANAMHDKIVFLKDSFESVRISEKVDVMMAHIDLTDGLLTYVPKYRDTLLKTGGRVIPGDMSVDLVPVNAESTWREITGVWRKGYYGIDFSSVLPAAVSRVHGHLHPQWPLATPCRVAHYDFSSTPSAPEVLNFKADFTIRSEANLHGFLMSYSLKLSPYITISNAPEATPIVWKRSFIPLEKVVAVRSGDTVTVNIRSKPHGSNSFWHWKTELRRNGRVVRRFEQTQWPRTRKLDLALANDNYQPRLSTRGKVLRTVLNLYESGALMGEVLEIVRSQFPEEFPDESTARAMITELMGDEATALLTES
jgi:type I protein arginine methyltransferase